MLDVSYRGRIQRTGRPLPQIWSFVIIVRVRDCLRQVELWRRGGSALTVVNVWNGAAVIAYIALIAKSCIELGGACGFSKFADLFWCDELLWWPWFFSIVQGTQILEKHLSASNGKTCCAIFPSSVAIGWMHSAIFPIRSLFAVAEAYLRHNRKTAVLRPVFKFSAVIRTFDAAGVSHDLLFFKIVIPSTVVM